MLAAMQFKALLIGLVVVAAVLVRSVVTQLLLDEVETAGLVEIIQHSSELMLASLVILLVAEAVVVFIKQAVIKVLVV
jgi:hypothetical protein